MNKFIPVVISILSLLSSCVGFYTDTNYDAQGAKEEEKKERVIDSLKSYVSSKTPPGYSYKSFAFGELYVIKDEEIKKLENLIDQRNKLEYEEAKYGSEWEKVKSEADQKVTNQKKYLKENNIFPWYEINHLYSYENVVNDSALIYEFDFEIYPNYKVKDVHQKMMVPLSPKKYRTFQFFMEQKPVYDSEDWQWENRMNQEFYNAALTALDNETEYKNELLLTILDMTDFIKENNKFDENDFAKKQMFQWENLNMPNNYKTVKIIQLRDHIDTINGQPILTGYNLERQVYESSPDSLILLNYEFDLNYVIVRVTEEKILKNE